MRVTKVKDHSAVCSSTNGPLGMKELATTRTNGTRIGLGGDIEARQRKKRERSKVAHVLLSKTSRADMAAGSECV